MIRGNSQGLEQSSLHRRIKIKIRIKRRPKDLQGTIQIPEEVVVEAVAEEVEMIVEVAITTTCLHLLRKVVAAIIVMEEHILHPMAVQEEVWTREE